MSWRTPQGMTHGVIVTRHERRFTFDGQQFTASKADPAFVVRSDKSGAEAAHKGSALQARDS